jgi:hypothetical protein
MVVILRSFFSVYTQISWRYFYGRVGKSLSLMERYVEKNPLRVGKDGLEVKVSQEYTQEYNVNGLFVDFSDDWEEYISIGEHPDTRVCIGDRLAFIGDNTLCVLKASRGLYGQKQMLVWRFE